MSIVVKGQIRFHRWMIWLLVKRLTRQVCIKNYLIAGSYRRGKWWCNDVDLVVLVSSDSEKEGIKARLLQLGWQQRPHRRSDDEAVFSAQYIKTVGDEVIVVDVFFTTPDILGNALLFATGSKEFNERIRENIVKMGYSWANPRYFTHIKTSRQISFATEQGALSFLG